MRGRDGCGRGDGDDIGSDGRAIEQDPRSAVQAIIVELAVHSGIISLVKWMISEGRV